MIRHIGQTALLALLLAVGAVTMAGPARAQGAWWFEGRRYFDPLVAGVREPHMSAVLGVSKRVEFQVKDKEWRPSWDIDVGTEFPLGGWESRAPTAQEGKVPAGAFGFGVWLPIDFHMLEDFADESNPIVNTDYRFGLMLKLQRGLSRGAHIGLRAHVGHESTHIGDEFAILGQRAHPATFERINVSWEYLDVAATYEHQFSTGEWLVRLGITATVPFRDTYYDADSASVTTSPRGDVTTSKNWTDPYVGGQVEWDDVFMGAAGYISAEARWRSVYDYHKTDADAGEDRQFSINLIAGLKPVGATPLGRTSVFARYYRGVNPHGQFRNQKDFSFIGLGVRLVR